MLKKLKQKLLESKLAKGYGTIGGIGLGLILPLLQAFGVDAASSEVDAIVAGIAAAITLWGKIRAVYQAQQGL